jgi:hypothetical protein
MAMLQGNPFETELWVQERTETVQRGVEPQSQSFLTKAIEKVPARPMDWTNQVRWRVKGWWLPVAFGLGTLLGLAVR